MVVNPFCSIGVLTFDDSRQTAREKLGSVFTTFAKDVGENETDAFDELGLHLYYDDADRLEFVEAFPPADVSFRGISFLDRDVDTVIAEMEAIGFEAIPSDVGPTFPVSGIALTAPYGPVEGVAAYRKGYYD